MICKFDVVLLQEIGVPTCKSLIEKMEKTHRHYWNPQPYSGTCVFISSKIVHECKIIIEGRLQEVIIKDKKHGKRVIYNNHHLAVSMNRKNLSFRMGYDVFFVDILKKRITELNNLTNKISLFGNMNSTARFYDSVANLKLKEDFGTGWELGQPLNEEKVPYERQFMNYFMRVFGFTDLGADADKNCSLAKEKKNFTYYEFDKPLSRTDFALVTRTSYDQCSYEIAKCYLSNNANICVEMEN
jgi:exonuclease III